MGIWTVAQIGNGFGSEFHLLRYLGRHRNRLNKEISAVVGCDQIRWLDFLVGRDKYDHPHDAEWKQLNFLPAGSPARKSWSDFWPQTGNQQNWDAVGVATFKHGDEWILVEAKAHKGELKSSCGASKNGGLSKIEDAMRVTKQHLDVAENRDWLDGYYQYCNRLAALNFLTERGVGAHLLFIYFVGDKFLDGSVVECPNSAEEWQPSLSAMEKHVGLAHDNPLKTRIHRVFLPVFPTSGSDSTATT